jgi:hypothetical protein
MDSNAMQQESLPAMSRPSTIGLALGLLWVGLVIGPLKLVLNWAYLVSRSGVAFNVLVVGVASAFYCFLVWKIGEGKNWARIAFLALFVLGVAPYIFILRSEFARSPLLGTMSILQAVIQGSALFLLFTSPGNEWFRQRKN